MLKIIIYHFWPNRFWPFYICEFFKVLLVKVAFRPHYNQLITMDKKSPTAFYYFLFSSLIHHSNELLVSNLGPYFQAQNLSLFWNIKDNTRTHAHTHTHPKTGLKWMANDVFAGLTQKQKKAKSKNQCSNIQKGHFFKCFVAVNLYMFLLYIYTRHYKNRIRFYLDGVDDGKLCKPKNTIFGSAMKIQNIKVK